jgi:PKD repeat protein
MKKIILLLLFFLFPIANTTFAYSVKTHKIISEKATENSKLALDKGDYLKNLGFQNNIDEVFSGKEVIKLIKDGSVDEDKSGRYVNHYHNPLKSWGEAGFFDITTGQSSLLWAQQDIPHEFPNEFSWQNVRQYYYDALTTGSEESFAKTFKGLGHIIHLLQDAAQPAHVRNDAHVWDSWHPFGLDLYNGLETWSKNKPDIISAFASQPVLPTVDLSVSVIGYEPITQFFDTYPDTYNGTNPSTSLSQGLAEYANANFASDDTIFTENSNSNHRHYFPFPRKEDTVEFEEYIEIDGVGMYSTYFRKIGNGETIDHFAVAELLYHYTSFWPSVQRTYIELDEQCHEDYTEKLIPRAVGYSTGLIDYFFRGDIDVIQVNSNNIKIKNNSSETMDGIFSLYYDATDGNRYQVSDGSWTLPPLQAGQTSNELTFTETTDIAEDKEYTLVFKGTLGSESNAIVGKVKSLKCGCVDADPDIGNPPTMTSNFTYCITSGDYDNPPFTVQFTDTSTENPTNWLWEFGDGEFSTDQNPTHIYQTAGPFNCKLTVFIPNSTDTVFFNSLAGQEYIYAEFYSSEAQAWGVFQASNFSSFPGHNRPVQFQACGFPTAQQQPRYSYKATRATNTPMFDLSGFGSADLAICYFRLQLTNQWTNSFTITFTQTLNANTNNFSYGLVPLSGGTPVEHVAGNVTDALGGILNVSLSDANNYSQRLGLGIEWQNNDVVGYEITDTPSTGDPKTRVEVFSFTDSDDITATIVCQ